MTVGGEEGGRDTPTATPWGTQNSGAGAVHGGAQACGGNIRKSPSEAADEARALGRHGARPAQREERGFRRENKGGKTLGVWGDDRVREASGVVENPGGGAAKWAGGRVATGRRHPRSG